MPTTLAAVNTELAKRGYTARLVREGGYFYFRWGEANAWLDRTVQAERISDRSVQEWVAEFGRLRKRNAKLAAEARVKRAGRSGKQGGPK